MSEQLLTDDQSAPGSTGGSGSVPRVGTEYTVLERVDQAGGWSVRDSVTASSSDQAVRMVGEQRGVTATYVAVPTRSFQPREIVVEQVTSVRLA